MSKLPQEMKRYPVRKNELLQGWDSADELILEHLGTLDLKNKRLLIVNDQFGAMSCALMDYDITTYTDSYVSFKGIELNSDKKIEAKNNLNELQGFYDFVLIQLPKNMSYFEDILATLSQRLKTGSMVICTSMVKHMAPMSFDLLQKYIGPTTTSLAKKKARLIFAPFEKASQKSPYPKEVKIEGFDKTFTNFSNLFSREKLDIGTRFFLEHIPQGPFERILDLGCANGIVGIKAKLLNPKATILFSDESAMAIQSAKTNFHKMTGSEAELYWTNCFENQPKDSVDLVLCNPPFHQQSTVGDFIAWEMFKDAHAVLKPGGKIRIIGNSHLGHQMKLKKLFGSFKMIATNDKFMICEAQKP